MHKYSVCGAKPSLVPGRRRNDTTWQLTWLQTVTSAGNWQYQSNSEHCHM